MTNPSTSYNPDTRSDSAAATFMRHNEQTGRMIKAVMVVLGIGAVASVYTIKESIDEERTYKRTLPAAVSEDGFNLISLDRYEKFTTPVGKIALTPTCIVEANMDASVAGMSGKVEDVTSYTVTLGDSQLKLTNAAELDAVTLQKICNNP